MKTSTWFLSATLLACVALAACADDPTDTSPSAGDGDAASAASASSSRTSLAGRDGGADAGARCTAEDVKTIKDVSASYAQVLADQATVAADLTKLYGDILAQADAGQGDAAAISADIAALMTAASKLDGDAGSALDTVKPHTPSETTVKTLQSDALTAFGNVKTIADAVVLLDTALASKDPSQLQGFEGQIQTILTSLSSLASSETTVANDLTAAVNACGGA